MNHPESRINELATRIVQAEKNGMIKDAGLEGATGKKVIAILQHAIQLLENDECYVEIGVYRGLSLISTSVVAPHITALGIDNFAQFDKNNSNKTFVENLIRQHQLHNTQLINMDFEDGLNSLEKFLNGKKIGLYFIDGPHDYRSQLICLLFAKKFLSEKAIIVIDNCNYNHVRQANQDFLKANSEFKLLFEGYTKAHPANLKGKALQEAWDSWLDGVNVLVKDPKNELPAMYPPTIRDRSLFFADHRIHPMRNSIFAWRAAKLAAVLKPFQPIMFVAYLLRLIIEVRKRKKSDIEPYPYINSLAKDLPYFNLNKPQIHS
ncbi:MAG: class I SAM-dependent methyltransferase [Flavobacteriales bacterium]|nr:class I SAM-dependent methyltransferase [Flavobacteriales bacterium]